jgi:hypothetical protein
MATFDMHSLLEQAGFRIRGRRADCVHCDGGSRLTVAFTTELAHCHRCKWSTNTFRLAQSLGLLRDNPEVRKKFLHEAEQRRQANIEVEKFDRWRNARIERASARYRSLARAAMHARDYLGSGQDDPHISGLAWDALARWYHAEARLSATLDYLSFSKASRWLEEDSTRPQVMDAWRQSAAAA